MNNFELKRDFWDKINDCYPAICDDCENDIIWVYDEKFIRNKKLYKLENKEITLPESINGTLLMVQNYNYKQIYSEGESMWNNLTESLGYDRNNRYHYAYMNTKKLAKKIFNNKKFNNIINSKIYQLKELIPDFDNYYMFLDGTYNIDGAEILYNMKKLVILR